MLVTVVGASAVVALAGELNGVPELVWIFKPLTTALLAWTAWRRGALADRYARAVPVALLLVLAGDLLTIPHGLLPAASLAYLCAGLALLLGLTAHRGLRLTGRSQLAGAIVVAAGLVVLWPFMDSTARVGASTLGIVIALVVGQAHSRARALAFLRHADAGSARLAAWGATLMLLAWFLFAFDRSNAPHDLAPIWIWGTHWAALTLIALSVPVVTLDRSRVAPRGSA